MGFKTDTLNLTRQSSNPSDVEGHLALVGASAGNSILKVYDNGWKSVNPQQNSNTVNHAAWSGAVDLEYQNEVANVLFYNTTEQGTNALKLRPTTDYTAGARIEVINGSKYPMEVSKHDGGNPNFNWSAGGGSVSVVGISPSQRALFVKTATAAWEVIVLSL